MHNKILIPFIEHFLKQRRSIYWYIYIYIYIYINIWNDVVLESALWRESEHRIPVGVYFILLCIVLALIYYIYIYIYIYIINIYIYNIIYYILWFYDSMRKEFVLISFIKPEERKL